MIDFNIIINGIEVLDKSISENKALSQTIENKIPELQKKEKRKRIFLYICFAVLIGVICLLTTSIQTLDKVDISLFLGMSFLICMMIGLGILFFVVQTKKLKVNEPSDISKSTNENIKQLITWLEKQKENCEMLLNLKNNLVDIKLLEQNNGNFLEYYYSEDLDTVKSEYIFIDTIEPSLKQKGASLVISETNEWDKKYKSTLYIEYELYNNIKNKN